jgi:hypothetical protein
LTAPTAQCTQEAKRKREETGSIGLSRARERRRLEEEGKAEGNRKGPISPQHTKKAWSWQSQANILQGQRGRADSANLSRSKGIESSNIELRIKHKFWS